MERFYFWPTNDFNTYIILSCKLSSTIPIIIPSCRASQAQASLRIQPPFAKHTPTRSSPPSNLVHNHFSVKGGYLYLFRQTDQFNKTPLPAVWRCKQINRIIESLNNLSHSIPASASKKQYSPSRDAGAPPI